MPLVRIDLRKGKSSAYKKTIADGIYRALRETFTVPDEDRFIVVTEHDNDGC
jgi:4-oxalocrotonate tautomerase